MNVYGWLASYSFLIMAIALLGASVPFLMHLTHTRIQFYLSLSAGVMLGAAFFHVMPDAFLKAGDYFGWWMSLGVVGLFCIERFIAPHSHEMNGHGHHHHGKDHGDHEHKHFDKGITGDEVLAGRVAEEIPGPKDHHAAAPALAGWMAIVGLTIHTFMNGVGLAGAVQSDIGGKMLPGLAMFLAVFLHKPADALAISTILARKGNSRRFISLVQIAYVSMVPAGALAFLVAGRFMDQGWQKELTGAALAFSAGTFIFVALSDLLPEVQFHRHDRIPLFLTLASGVILMGFIAILEDMGKEPEEPPAAQKVEHPARAVVNEQHADRQLERPH